MKTLHIANTIGGLLVAAALFLPSGTKQASATEYAGCPATANTCATLYQSQISRGCVLKTAPRQTNPIYYCSTTCDGELTGHMLSGEQIYYHYGKCYQCPGSSDWECGGNCEETTVSYGEACGNTAVGM